MVLKNLRLHVGKPAHPLNEVAWILDIENKKLFASNDLISISCMILNATLSSTILEKWSLHLRIMGDKGNVEGNCYSIYNKKSEAHATNRWKWRIDMKVYLKNLFLWKLCPGESWFYKRGIFKKDIISLFDGRIVVFTCLNSSTWILTYYNFQMRIMSWKYSYFISTLT